MLLTRRSVFAAKVESEIGTAETLGGAEGVFNARSVLIQPNITIDEREGQGGFNYLLGIPGLRSGTATFTTELSYDGAAIPTWASVLLPACGFINSTGTFSPLSRGPSTTTGQPKTLTIGAYVDGTFRVLSGCMGNFVINLPTGKMASIDWTFQGKWENPTDATIIGPTYPTALPLRFAEGTIEFDDEPLCVANASIDSGNEVVLRECAGDITGIISAVVTNRKPVITADPEAVLVATQDRHDMFLTPTAAELAIVIGEAAGGTVTIAAPKAQITNIQQADRNGIYTDAINWMATKGASADTELTIAFTAATP